MPGGTRRVRGPAARQLPATPASENLTPSQQDTLDSLADDSNTDPLIGIVTPADLVPLADGSTPGEQREAARTESETSLNADSAPATTAAEASLPRIGQKPHYFKELEHQSFYHDVVVYIEGEDVSSFLQGSLEVTYGFGSDFNKCNFTLNNAGHRFTLTPENLRGVFRRSGPTGEGVVLDYDETVKANMYERKNRQDYNPVDPLSGGRRFPMHLWSTVFHKNDSVRVWIHNPASEEDEWIPVFTGFVVSKPVTEDYLTGLNTMSVSCADIRTLMAMMRVNNNTLLATAAVQQTTSAADPTNTNIVGNDRIFKQFREQANKAFDRSFFKDLVASSINAIPWTNLNLAELVSALTWKPGTSRDMIEAADTRSAAAENGAPVAETASDRSRRIGTERGSGRIGRLLPGVFPTTVRVLDSPIRPYWRETFFPDQKNTLADTNRAIREHMERWYSLCVFGSPVRHDFVPRSIGDVWLAEDAPLDHSLENRRYWTLDEVHQAGRSTRREGAWHPEAQAVHYLSPGRGTPNDNLLQESVLSSQNVSGSQNWTTRLQLLCDSCETCADYRFWVSGTGDLIFEFPQYDFSPSDYGPWSDVLTLDHHLLLDSFDEEGGPVTTAVVANGSWTKRGDINESTQKTYNPVAVGVWSPALASRHGLTIKMLTFSQIDDRDRLESLATLSFQKLLAAADKYQIGLAFRPWLTLNRPIYNRYRERIALIDGLSWTLPVTSGQLAGFNSPTSSLQLNYSRSYDELGIPRYITGGPSNPMYFGIPGNGGPEITASLQSRVRDFRASLAELTAQGRPFTTEELASLRARYRGIIPNNQAQYNVIDAAMQDPSVAASGEPNPLFASFTALEIELDELNRNVGSISASDRSRRITDIENRMSEIMQTLSPGNPAAASNVNTESTLGSRPQFGVSGVRSTTATEDSVPDEVPFTPPCITPKGLHHSAPISGRYSLPLYSNRRLGPAKVGLNGAFHAFRSSTHTHQGIDVGNREGTPLLAIGNGKVVYVSLQYGLSQSDVTGTTHTRGIGGYGRQLVIKLDVPGQPLYALYAHAQSFSVGLGARVSTGQQIGTMGKSQFFREDPDDSKRDAGQLFREDGTPRNMGPHLHFEISREMYPMGPERDVRIDPTAWLMQNGVPQRGTQSLNSLPVSSANADVQVPTVNPSAPPGARRRQEAARDAAIADNVLRKARREAERVQLSSGTPSTPLSANTVNPDPPCPPVGSAVGGSLFTPPSIGAGTLSTGETPATAATTPPAVPRTPQATPPSSGSGST